MAKEGSTIGGLMDAIATLVSVSLQYGVPVESLVRKFKHVRFEPSGMTRNSEIPFAKSLVDYIFRWLAMEFVPGYRAAHAPKREKKIAPAVVQPEPEKPTTFGDLDEDPEPSSNISTTLPTTGDPKLAQPPAPPAKKGNGHHPRTDPDTAKPFDYGDVPMSAESPAASSSTTGNLRLTLVADPLSQQGSHLQADAPACDVCGSITVRSGTCYKCLNCGNSMCCS